MKKRFIMKRFERKMVRKPEFVWPLGATWKERFLGWLATKMRVRFYWEVETEDVSFVDVDIPDLKTAVAEVLNLYQFVDPKKIDRIVVGPELFNRFIVGTLNEPLLMRVDLRFRRGDSYTLMGIPVQMVPWIDGFAVLPKMKEFSVE